MKKLITSRQQVSTWLVKAQCSESGGKCGGELRFSGTVLMSDPPWYVHTCERCGSRRDLREKYPKIEHHPDGGI